ncbi:MAG: alanine--tRNA ligase [Patescibacteria group bacterium]|nr:alanine--tRNA ligase [Patescibacteria group bacterium]MDD5715080.1 alanine--tRNA ligase [Patescibacteria group bacterium]
MTSDKIRQTFLKYFKGHKVFSHTIIPSSSLWPHDDPSILLTTAGMQQLKPYFMGTADPRATFGSNLLTSCQRCFRTSDIDEVGDGWHNTFFEMLGNFSINGYFRKEAIQLAWDCITNKLKLPIVRLWVTYFNGENGLQEDSETKKIWLNYVEKNKIVGFGSKENWWGPAGKIGPCGPCSEIHFDLTGKPCARGNACKPNCPCGRFVELWNLVFMQYRKNEKALFEELPYKNIDTGAGLERLSVILQKKKNVFETDLFEPLIEIIKHDVKFGTLNKLEDTVRSYIAADHIKASVLLLSDGIQFSNKEQGYVLRRIFRRAIDQYLHPQINFENLVDCIIRIYRNIYLELPNNREKILTSMQKEAKQYEEILNIDIEEVVKKMLKLKKQTKSAIPEAPIPRTLSSEEAFKLYSTYGISPDRLKRSGFNFDQTTFEKLIQDHQQLSRSTSHAKFGGHGLGSSELSDFDRIIMTKYHTATHLLHQALRQVLGTHVRQQGSDISPERLRFDFEHTKKLTDDEKIRIESIVNGIVDQNIPVQKTEMSYTDAIQSGALAFFKDKYPEHVSVYTIGTYSKEVCGGPHVSRTGEIGHIKIVGEKSSSAGVRRIKAIIEKLA